MASCQETDLPFPRPYHLSTCPCLKPIDFSTVPTGLARLRCRRRLHSLCSATHITDPSGRPFFSLSVATAGLCIVGDLRENNRWKEIGQLQQRYQVGPYFLKGFVRKLHTAIPAVWFTLPDTEATPSLLSIFFPPKTPIPLSSKRMYVQMVKCGDVRPLAEDKWTLPSWSEGWSTACSALRDARLNTHIPTILLSNFSIAFFRLQTV